MASSSRRARTGTPSPATPRWVNLIIALTYDPPVRSSIFRRLAGLTAVLAALGSSVVASLAACTGAESQGTRADAGIAVASPTPALSRSPGPPRLEDVLARF